MYLGAAAQVLVQRYNSVSSKPCLIFKSCSSGSSSWEEGERGRRQREGERRWAGTGWISWSSSPLLRWLIIMMMMTITIFKMSNTLNGSNEPWWPWLGGTRGPTMGEGRAWRSLLETVCCHRPGVPWQDGMMAIFAVVKIIKWRIHF